MDVKQVLGVKQPIIVWCPFSGNCANVFI